MVGEGARAGEPRAALRQRRVEFLRIGDAGKADHRQYAEPARIAARRHARLQHRLVRRLEALGERRCLAAFADQEQRIGARHLLVEGARNGPAGMTSPLPSPVAASTTIRLKSLASCGFWKPSSMTITVASVPSISLRLPRGPQPPRLARARQAAAFRRRPPPRSRGQHRALRLAAVAAGEKARAFARFLQLFGDGNGRRGLAAAAGREIADADHREPRAVRRDAGHPPLRHAPIDRAKRRQC